MCTSLLGHHLIGYSCRQPLCWAGRGRGAAGRGEVYGPALVVVVSTSWSEFTWRYDFVSSMSEKSRAMPVLKEAGTDD